MNNIKRLFAISAAVLMGALLITGCAGKEAVNEYRAFFENSGLEGKMIYVIGHKSPDTDTVGSAIAYSNLLNELGYESEPRIASEKINNETKYVLENCGIETPEFLKSAAEETIVMVDHNEMIQAADGMDEAHVVAIIDHHVLNTEPTEGIVKIEIENIGAAATLVALEYEKCDVKMEPVMAKLLAYTILSDTENLTKGTTTAADREVYERLAAAGGIKEKDRDKIYDEMKVAKKSFAGMSDEEIYFSDYKEYEINGYTYAIPTMGADDAEAVKELGGRMEKIMAQQLATGKYDFIFTKIKDSDADAAYIYVCGEGVEELCRKAFPDAEFFDGYIVITPSVSRKTVMVPAINAVLE